MSLNSRLTTAFQRVGTEFKSVRTELAARVNLTTAQTIGGAKTFSSPVVVPDPTISSHAATRAFVEAALASLPPMGQRVAYAEKTAFWGSTAVTNQVVPIPGLDVTFVAPSRPVEVEFFAPICYATVGGVQITALLMAGGGKSSGQYGASGNIFSYSTVSGPSIYFKRQIQYIPGTTYTLSVCTWASAASTHALGASVDTPMFLSVKMV